MGDLTHLMIEMTRKPDCRVIGTWLLKVAAAQALWSAALKHLDLDPRLLGHCASCAPSLEAGALELLFELKRSEHVVAIDLTEIKPALVFELALLARLGFFVLDGHGYVFALPSTIVIEDLERAISQIVATACSGEDAEQVIRPELLLNRLPKSVAEAWRSWMVTMPSADITCAK